MARVQIRFESDEIPNKLSALAKRKGYVGREEFLREVLEDIAYEERVKAVEARYEALLERHEKLMTVVSDALAMNLELGLLRPPFQLEGGNEDE